MTALRRVGHKGADDIAPGNTIASFDAALAADVDMIEFDVLAADRDDPAGSELILAHDYRDAGRREPPTLDEGLTHLAAPAFAAVDLDVDLKLPGYEGRVVEALRRHNLVDRSLVSSQYPRSLAAVRALEPALRLGWSVPKASRDYTKSPVYALPAYAALRGFRATLPRRAARGLRENRFDAVMAHWRVVSRSLVQAINGAGGELYVWTVDEIKRIEQLEAMGVTGVITNDPRLFALASEKSPSPNA
jgi:glycerophosphoryl diester phosphodiesterase